jgi:hypothetical protein
MAARRYRGHRMFSFLTVMLASTLLREKPPPRLPGKDRQTVPAVTCPRDQGELVQTKNGKLRCQKCGKLFSQAPKPG